MHLSYHKEQEQIREPLTVNFGRPEFSCLNAIVKEQVNLAECAVLGLRKAEPAPDVAEKVGAGVEEAGFGTPIPGYGKG